MRASILFAIAGFLHVALRGRSAALRCLVWQVAFTGVLLAPVAVWLLPSVPEPSWITQAARSLPVNSPPEFSRIIVPIGWLGTFVLLARMLFDLLAAWRLRRRSVVQRRQDGVEIRTHDQPFAPFAWSFGHRAILLPAHLMSSDAQSLQAVIHHERAHLQRGDGWWLLVAQSALALHWFNPLAWIAWIQLRRQMEWACDDAVLRSGVPADGYASTLLAFAGSGGVMPTLPAMSGASKLEARFMHILSENKNRNALPVSTMLVSMALGLTLILPMAALADGKTYSASDPAIQKPVLVEKIEPSYTERAKAEKIEGTVLLRIEIDEKGATQNQSVVKGLDPDLDAAALQAISQWKFQPATKSGEPVRVFANVEIHFRLK